MEESVCFELGDSVRLKFGGPVMTVLGITQGDCCCMWFEDGRMQHGRFETDVLEWVERPVSLLRRD